MNKVVGIISKLIANQYQLIIKKKTPQESWAALQERFQYINLINIFWIIYKATTKKLSDFKNIYKYISYYQAFFDKFFDKLLNFFTIIFFYI